ncbi:anthocyanidin 3-O-glucosyltransferase 5-like [Rutidosis leptorrhynchoides]|uniref:anthocyanidin 3-O-glucosyltransferase 5-like n=1 Tax=Rutidosis leptorrhynchoides TaxID=125765 RepID=UPI003A997DD1
MDGLEVFVSELEVAGSSPDGSLQKSHVVFLPSPGIGHLTPLYELALVNQHNIRNDTKPKALVIDIFSTDVFETCTDLSIPIYVFFTASAVLFTLSLYLLKLDREIEGEFVDLNETIKVPGCNPVRNQDAYHVVNPKSDEYKWYMLHVSKLPMVKGIFVNTWDDLEPVSLEAVKNERFFLDIPTPPVYPIGPLTKRVEPVCNEHEKEIIAWLDKQPKDSVLFIALGSGGTLSSEQLTELAYGLELSQQRFVFVVRKPSDYAAAAFFDVGSEYEEVSSYLPEGFLKRTNRVGLVVNSWAPHVVVLKHSSTGAFLSHCGWNSTLESVKHGVPMIARPMYSEQRMNATVLSDEVGVAVKVPVVGDGGETVVVGRDEIAKVVREVMEGEKGKKLRCKAKELEASGRNSLSRGGSGFETLARVVESWKLN